MFFFAKRLLLLLVLASAVLGQAQNSPKLELILDEDSPDFGALWYHGLDPLFLRNLPAGIDQSSEMESVLKVIPHVANTRGKDHLPGMLGQYQLRRTGILFKPRLPFVEGNTYRVTIDGRHLCRLVELKDALCNMPEKKSVLIDIPRRSPLPPTQVTQVYPTTSQLPINLLKWYICFSTPMSLERIYPHIRLLDVAGQEVETPFLELQPELWDRQRQCLTLWMDPGRIKSHLAPHQAMGMPLETGEEYSLVIDTTFKDAYGQYLDRPYVKTFSTQASDRLQPQVEEWQLSVPPVGSRQPVRLDFPESMDWGVLKSFIAVFDDQDHQLSGTITIGTQERSWRFNPDEAWKAGSYHLKISKDLEDLAGNNLDRLFDTNIAELPNSEEATAEPAMDFVVLKFEIKRTEEENLMEKKKRNLEE